MTPEVTVEVPAKINLELRVGPLRPDGYHDLATVFHAVDLIDRITVRRADEWGITVEGTDAHLVPEDDSNLALAAAKMLGGTHHGQASPVHVHIEKTIPVAGGMAGGSADAAGALVACDELWRLGLGVEGLHEYAARLGSDVNFALVGATAIGTGRGEQIRAVPTAGRYHWVIVVSDQGLSTPTVFRHLDELRAERDVADADTTETLLAALREGDASTLGSAMHNDLQEPALSLRPDLARVIDAGLERGALAGLVSGSGPTVVFLAVDETAATALAADLMDSGIAHRAQVACGPVPGARVVAD